MVNQPDQTPEPYRASSELPREQGRTDIEYRNKEKEIFETFKQNDYFSKNSDYFPRNLDGSGSVQTGKLEFARRNREQKMASGGFANNNIFLFMDTVEGNKIEQFFLVPDDGSDTIKITDMDHQFEKKLIEYLKKTGDNGNPIIIAYHAGDKFVPLRVRNMTDEEVNQKKEEDKEGLELNREPAMEQTLKDIEMIENGSAGDQSEVRSKLSSLFYGYIRIYGEDEKKGITYAKLNALSDKNNASFFAAAEEGVVKYSSKDQYTIELSSGELITIERLAPLNSREKVSVICNDKDILLRKEGDEIIYKLEYVQ